MNKEIVSLFQEAMDDLATNGIQLMVIELIREERRRQDAKWGFPQDNSACEWMTILTEEVGEAAQEALRTRFDDNKLSEHVDNFRKEIVQVAAVCVGILESLELGVVRAE